MRPTEIPDLVRFLVRQAAAGALIALATVALLVIGDVGGLRGLVVRSDVGPLALGVMTVFFVITFAGVQMAAAVMLYLSRDGGEEPPRGRPARPAAVRGTSARA